MINAVNGIRYFNLKTGRTCSKTLNNSQLRGAESNIYPVYIYAHSSSGKVACFHGKDSNCFWEVLGLNPSFLVGRILARYCGHICEDHMK